MFYTRDVMTVCEGEQITGHVVCRPNIGNHRDLDISVDYGFEGRNQKISRSQIYRLR